MAALGAGAVYPATVETSSVCQVLLRLEYSVPSIPDQKDVFL